MSKSRMWSVIKAFDWSFISEHAPYASPGILLVSKVSSLSTLLFALCRWLWEPKHSWLTCKVWRYARFSFLEDNKSTRGCEQSEQHGRYCLCVRILGGQNKTIWLKIPCKKKKREADRHESRKVHAWVDGINLTNKTFVHSNKLTVNLEASVLLRSQVLSRPPTEFRVACLLWTCCDPWPLPSFPAGILGFLQANSGISPESLPPQLPAAGGKSETFTADTWDSLNVKGL